MNGHLCDLTLLVVAIMTENDVCIGVKVEFIDYHK